MRRYKTAAFVAGLLCAAACPNPVHAVYIFGDLVEWNRTTDPMSSPPMNFSIFRDMGQPAEALIGWQLRAFIVPQPGAMGTLYFNGPTLVPEASYLLMGRSGGLGGGVNMNDQGQMFVFDDDTTVQGVIAPEYDLFADPFEPPRNLLTARFITPDDARGTFDIWAVGAPGDTQWADNQFRDREFDNVPFIDFQPIGQVVVVPEPFRCWSSMGCLAACVITVRRRYVRYRTG